MFCVGIISNNKVVLLSIITIFYILQYIVILQIDYKPEKTNTFKSSIKYLLHSKSKYKIIYAWNSHNRRLFVPLYLYIALKDFKAFSVVVVISLLFQIITVTLIGKYTDKNIKG